MADQTTLPTCTPGSLGGPKLDRRPFIDPKKDDSAAEVMLRNACIEELFRRMGLSSGAAAGSVEARLLALEAAGGGSLDLMNPQLHFRADDFDDWTALSTPGWDNGGGVDPWEIIGGLRGGLRAPFADTCLMQTPPIYARDQYPHVRFICKVDAWDTSIGSQFQSVLRLLSDDSIQAGVRIYDYGSEGTPPQLFRRIEGIVTDGMGGVTATDCGVFSDATYYDIHWWIEMVGGSVKLFVSVNGATAIDCGVVMGADDAYLSVAGPHVALGTANFFLYQMRRKAIWTPPGLPAMEYGE